MSIRTVISVDDSVYLHWQSQLLQHSHAKVGQPGALTRLVATNDRHNVGAIDAFETVATRPCSPHPATGDFFPPYNKPGSLCEWLTGESHDDETILLLDPDCVFVRPMFLEVEAGRPFGEEITYMDAAGQGGALVINRHCRNHRQKVQPIGIPILIARSDLRDLCPRWWEVTCQIRDDEQSRDLVNWTSEMWGYVIAAAELGLHHELAWNSRMQFEDAVDRPLIHYCYETENHTKTWRWTKREYQAWAQVSPAPDDVPAAGRFLHSLVEEVSRKFQHRRLS